MKKLSKLIGIAAVAAVIGCFLIACGEAEGGASGGHTHTYSTTWSYNATQHWHECTAGDGAKTDVGNHDGDPCLICGYSADNNQEQRLVISGALSRSQRSIGSRAAAETDADTQTFRVELGDDNRTLNGKLEDGSIIFTLTGQYDESTKVFSVQAPSSFVIFSIVGKLDDHNDIDTDSTSASVKVKDRANGEWTSEILTVASSDETVDSDVNADSTGVTSMPNYARGMFTDQILALYDYSFNVMINPNSITVYEQNQPPRDFTVVEVTNANGGAADENGPWNLILQGKCEINGVMGDYNAKFYVSKEFDGTMRSQIGETKVADIYGEGDGALQDAVNTLPSGIKMFVVPYCGSGDSIHNTVGMNLAYFDPDIVPNNGFSPLFKTTAFAKAATVSDLKAKIYFMLALK